MSDLSPRLALPLLMPSQAQKHVTHNEALRQLDVAVQLVIAGFEASQPPASPAVGDCHALGAAPEGAWAGQAGTLAVWTGSQWQFAPPQPGWIGWDQGGGVLRVWTGSAWVPAAPQQLDQLGIATPADGTNRLAVASPASLFSHVGAGHQVKINKASPGDTASLLFQSGWSGRAEMGLTGDNAFHLKTSSDGSSWQDRLTVTGTRTGINTAAPLSELEVAQTGAAGINISATRTGSAFGNAYLRFNAPRSSSADGGTVHGRGAIALLGNGTDNEAQLWLNANTASLDPEGGDDATFKGYQAGLRIGSNGSLGFWDGGVERFGLDATGPVRLQAGVQLTPGASALEDYEEGSWTPVLSDGTNQAAMSVNAGSYTRIGDTVHVRARILLTSKGSLSGGLRITGLPFASRNQSIAQSGVNFHVANTLALPGPYTLSGRSQQNTDLIYLGYWGSTTGTQALQASHLTDTSEFWFEMTYQIEG